MADLFDEFWPHYPRKTAKAVARRAFKKAITKTTLAVMVAALAWQKQTEQWQRGIIPHAATWLNQERWEDEPPPPTTPAAPALEPWQRKALLVGTRRSI